MAGSRVLTGGIDFTSPFQPNNVYTMHRKDLTVLSSLTISCFSKNAYLSVLHTPVARKVQFLIGVNHMSTIDVLIVLKWKLVHFQTKVFEKRGLRGTHC